MKPSSVLAVLLLPPSSSRPPMLMGAANATPAVADREGAAPVASDPRRDASTSGAETCRSEAPRGAEAEAPDPGRPPTATAAAGDDGDYDYGYGDIFADYDYVKYDESSGQPPTLGQMSRMRRCHKLPAVGRPLYAEEDWRRLREIYREQGGGTIKFQSEVAEGFVPPMRSGQTTDGKGRGVFAARDIQEGEMTYGGVAHYAHFNDGPSYRNFLAALSNHEACDVLSWTWSTDTPWGPVILLVLDDNALQNNADDPGEANTGPRTEMSEDPTRMSEEYALRDIAEGEELLCDYSLFSDSSWEHFGL